MQAMTTEEFINLLSVLRGYTREESERMIAGIMACSLPYSLELPGLGQIDVLTPRPDDLLTKREKDVANLLAQGLNDEEISDALSISKGTCKKHRQHIAAKFGVKEDLSILQAEAKRRWYGKQKEA